MDPRVKQLAYNLITNSVCLKPGEKILIWARETPSYPLAAALIEAAYAAGGLPFYKLTDAAVSRAFAMGVTEAQLKLEEEHALAMIKEMQAFITFAAPENQFSGADVSPTKSRLISSISEPSSEYRVNHTRWCVLRCPTPGMAQAAAMSNEAFEDFYFKVCLLDYAKMSQAMDALVRLMQKTDRVRIAGPGTDLYFSIKGIPAVKCDGKMNIPDGEVFTAPVRESVDGFVSFTAPTIYESKRFSGVRLGFQDGKIISASCEQGSEKEMLEILDRDANARYIGEFAIGLHPYIIKPMLNILFDEKIAGSFHFTPGICYPEAPNGNKSQIHWDMVCIQTPEYGGGEIWFDDILVRKDGRFVLPELACLNPENLL